MICQLPDVAQAATTGTRSSATVRTIPQAVCHARTLAKLVNYLDEA